MFESAPLPEAPPDLGPPEAEAWAEALASPVDAETRALLDGLAASYAAAPAAGVVPFAVEDMPPGPELAGLLAGCDVSSAVDSYDVVEAVAGWERLAAWVAAGETMALAELAARAELRPADTGHRSVNPITNTAIVVAGRCQLTAKQAENQVGHAVQLVGDFPDTWAALEAGLIDLRRVRAITDELGGQDPAVRARVEAAVLPRAPFLDSVALRKWVKRLLHELAPVETAERVRVAREGRYVSVTPASDGMAHLEARLPAEDATALNTALNVAAADAKRADAAAGASRRTRDQRRADALADLGWNALAACAATATATATGQVTHARAAAAAGPATNGPVHGSSSDTRGGTARIPDRASAPTGRTRATAGDPADRADAAAQALTGTPAPAGRAPSSSAASGAAHGAVRRRPVAVNVTIPFGTLAGLSDEPGELEGYGPIPAHVARELAAAGVWTWLRTDPGSGRLLDLGRTRYRPTKALADFITARDRTCRAPGCHRPATSCDLDHVIPWERGGTTSAANLQSLCEAHHLLKHHGGWRVTREPDGTTVWTSPTGHRFRRPPDPPP